ncbi:MAG: hypothetical protein WED34_19495 [Planctomycetales bacterium]
MDEIRLIRDKAELQGTCYFELLPGDYEGQHWNDRSVFLAEEVFGLIEPIIVRHEPRFDHYSFVGIRRPAWERIIADLERLAARTETASGMSDLRGEGEVGFLFTTTETEFARHFRSNADALASLLRELLTWVRQRLREYECISVLGM